MSEVTFPNGTTAEIVNPLYQYKFHPLDNTQINGTGCPDSIGGIPELCQNSQVTIRNGKVTSDNAGLDKKIRNELRSQRSKLYRILSQWQTFDAFSNSGNCGGQGRIGTLEELHNALHNNNWPGHMSPASVSAFDPMFWLHHANVDRQMAIYQALYPETYVGACTADTPTYTITAGDALDENSPLKPFHKTAGGEFWTSANSRNIWDIGYTYPELVGTPSNATLISSIKAQYSGPSDVLVESAPFSATQIAAQSSKRGESEPTVKHNYLAEVKLPLFALSDGSGGGSPYNLLVFLGNVSTDSRDWLSSEEFAGMASVLGGRNMHSDQFMTTTIDLSENLEEKIAAGETTMENATEYLMANLHWRLELVSLFRSHFK
jgi:tyrosinase